MTPSRAPLGAILLAILAASCSPGRSSVTVAVAGVVVPTQLVGTTEATPCSISHGDGPFDTRVVTIVRASTPVSIRVDVAPGAEIRGRIYDTEVRPPSSGPLEEFTLSDSGTHQSRSMVAARTYEVIVSATRSVLGFRSEVGHAFRVRVEPP
jgi:hypothetical protein